MTLTALGVGWKSKPPAPYYWSGTNCRAFGSFARLGEGEVALADYRIEIGNTIVYSQHFDFDLPWTAVFSWKPLGPVIFDSTHFPNADDLVVTCYARAYLPDGVLGPWGDDGGNSAKVKNEAMCAQSGDFRSIPGGEGDASFTFLFDLTEYGLEKKIY